MRRPLASSFSRIAGVAIATAVLILALSSVSFASDIRVMCTTAFKGTLEKVRPQYERESGDKLLITYDATAGLLNRVNKGEPFDVFIAVTQAVGDLAKAGKVVDSSRVDVARSGIGIAVRQGAPKPDLRTVEALKKSLLAAKAITYTDPAYGGASSVYFAELVKKMGIAEQLLPKTKLALGGTSSAVLVVSGQADLAVQMISELIATPGVEIAGPLPAEVQKYAVVNAAIAKPAADSKPAQNLLIFLSSPKMAPALREAGLEPPK